MDLWEAVVIAFRRWYVVIPVLAGGLLLGQIVANSVDPIYRADATVQYRAPSFPPDDEEAIVAVNSNPYLSLSPLITATEVYSQGDAVAIELADQGFGNVAYSVRSEARSPLMVIQTESTDPSATLGALGVLTDVVIQDAFDRQVAAIGDQPDYFVELEVIDSDVVPQTDLTSRTRTRILMAAVAFILAIVAAVGLESLLGHLRRRREDPDDIVEEQPGVVWFGLPVSGGQTVQPPPQQLTAISGGSDWRDDRIREAAAEERIDEGDDLRPTGSEKRRTRWAR